MNYKILISETLIFEEQLNELLKEGWKLITIVPSVPEEGSVALTPYYFYFEKIILLNVER